MIKSKRYDDETLKHLQQVEMKLFKYFIEVCEEHDLTYFMYAGSLLGTIRHQGFIPWDDDIDVIMFREDFEKLNKIFEKNIDEKYGFFNVLNEETYHYTWGRLTLKNTLFKEWWADQVDYTPNIFLDIFILDNVPNNKFKKFIHRWTCFSLNQLTMYSILKFKNNSKIKELVQQTIYYTLKIIPISPSTIKKKCVKSFSKYQYENCEEVCDFPSENLMPISFKTDWLPIKKAKFEDLEVNIPNNYDKILRMDFNNYMELPPEESRFNPAPEEIDFGKY
ncbi:phosphorylcholine transferase LicD [Methanobrevibacter sp.]|uniref:LicD family protein n=1 Tax=Methanobrevibacter sp. TaxID=66852 RepID=UPI0025F9EB3B|nr:LicD family protein [Methanobrevibacter sp.]MBQ2832648.1 LicD family protein [Methanobrevibacter sp.]